MSKTPVALIFTLFSFAAFAAPPAGTLVIVGGGDRPDEVMDAFMTSSGGKNANICLVTTSTSDPEGAYSDFKVLTEKYGARLTRVDVKKREESSSPEILNSVKPCTGIWFTGGDQSRVGDAIVGTPLHQLVLEKYQKGGTIGGTSAGAAIQSKIMLTGEDSDGNESLEKLGTGAYKTREGMGFLPEYCIVDQHFLRRNRQNRLFSVLMSNPTHLGLGIDEETGLLVKNGKAMVIGNSKVMVFDTTGMTMKGDSFNGMKIHVLEKGQGIELATRKLIYKK